MTIHSQWLAVFKKLSPESFSKVNQFQPKSCFVDGMPSLMVSSHVSEWKDIVHRNFGFAVNKYFKMGCQNVVIGFDHYDYVSSGKSITQHNRAKKVAPFEFGAGESLPTFVPRDYNEKIRNRAFKRAVIDYIATHLPRVVHLEKGKSLIIDYVHAPVRYFLDPDTGVLQHEYMGLPPMGECDLKAVRFAELFGDMIIHSVDGDFLPISMIFHEKLVAQKKPLNLAVYRLEYKADAVKCTGKRSSHGETKKAARTWEFVNVPSLYNALERAMRGWAKGEPCMPMSVAIATMIALTGTDFTRALPHVPPERLWECLSHKRVWQGLSQSYDVESDALDVDAACDLFVAELYKLKFSKHTSGPNLQRVMQNLQGSKLAPSTRAQLPSLERVRCTIKNVNFLLIYWKCISPRALPFVEGGEMYDYSVCFPEAVSEEYGFKRKRSGKGAVTWLDDED